MLREEFRKVLPAGFPLEKMLGLVETSIGKMVPIMSAKDRERDPLLVYAEAYNTLILDKKAFLAPIPEVPGLDPKDNMKAYVERKSFIHNLGHAMLAYMEGILGKDYTFTYEAVRDAELRAMAKAAMWESGRALIEAYPDEFNEINQEEHIENLLKRFGNAHLGDTIFRVGRDVRRKLARDDRLIGAMRFDLERGIEPLVTAQGAAAACFFRKTDERGQLFGPDEDFRRLDLPKGLDYILGHVCGLTETDDTDRRVSRPHPPPLRPILNSGHNTNYLISLSRKLAENSEKVLCPEFIQAGIKVNWYCVPSYSCPELIPSSLNGMIIGELITSAIWQPIWEAPSWIAKRGKVPA